MTALTADYLDFSVASGNTQYSLTGGAGKKLIIPSLYPTLVSGSEHTGHLEFKPYKLSIFFPAALQVL